MVIDHIGIVVESIEEARGKYEDLLGFRAQTEIIFEPHEKINTQFLVNEKGERIQLIEPVDDSSPVFNALQKGGGVNHICYRCSNIRDTLKKVEQHRCVVVRSPFAGAGVGGRQVAFAVHPDLGIVEFVEGEADEALETGI